ncbi:MAG: hypothetical protein WA880_12915 [Ornithinimicrobium sp.]
MDTTRRIAAHQSTTAQQTSTRQLFNKVPEVTLYFWIIKILATTVGETIADYLTATLGFSLNNASITVGALLAAILIAQFRANRYLAPTYWLAVVLISVAGTLITDNMVDDYGVSLWTTTAIFSVALAATFAIWYATERTLSIHAVTTHRREAFYWTAILFTFALGTAAGDLLAESVGLGFATSALVFAAAIAAIAVAHLKFGLNAVLAFWLAYILTRPLGASIGDLLSQAPADGGLGFGTTATSGLFLAAIAGTVAYLAITKRDVETAQPDKHLEPAA